MESVPLTSRSTPGKILPLMSLSLETCQDVMLSKPKEATPARWPSSIVWLDE